MALTPRIDHTHSPSLRSWLPSAAAPGTDFPIQNLPLGIFARRGSGEAPRAGMAIGDRILDLAACRDAGFFTGEAARAAEPGGDASLNRLAALGRPFAAALRAQASALLAEGDKRIRSQRDWEARFLPPMEEAELRLPFAIGDYTDFYASVHHAANVGRLFRPDQPLLPNYKHVPIGYHGRASSIVASGTPIRRPRGQILVDQAHPSPSSHPSQGPAFGPSQVLDYEVEAGLFVGPGNALGEPIPIAAAEDHLFGVCLLNDWSARDIQKWEYQPLGPFLSKSFTTSLSPWVTTLDALEPYRVPAAARPAGDPAPLAYLDQGAQASRAAFDIRLDLFLSTARMRESGMPPHLVSRSRTRSLYWTPGQLIAHHASNGCNLRPGDLLGTGTVSGPERENEGCLLERTRGGKEPIELPDGEIRRFLLDGDEVILRGYCEAEGFARIGLGECRGLVLPAA